MIVEARSITKRFGKFTAVDNLSFTIKEGSITGLIGPNGAGKTTTMGMLTGLIKPSAGEVLVLGKKPEAANKDIGFLPQDAQLHPQRTALDHLTLYGKLKGYTKTEAKEEGKKLLQLFKLQDRKTGQLSHGQRKIVGIAQAILGTPRLIILDEPTAGLDPGMAHHLKQQLLQLRKKATLFISSHNLAELEQLCDEVIIMQEGKLIVQEKLKTFLQQQNSVAITLEQAAGSFVSILKTLKDATVASEANTLTITFSDKDKTPEVIAILVKNKARIRSVHQASLEDSVVKLVHKP
ncbi:ABC transporter ATP-binding protein [Candidatus Woesearchaeota archaeon]|nr:ABC transporter ATP-binding protein [Candidatus Woesearchaeota archaeon]